MISEQANALLSARPQPRRHKTWGGYLADYQGKWYWPRATGFAGELDSLRDLHNWEKRMMARGLVARPELLAAVAATPPEKECSKEDKGRLNEILVTAKEAAGGAERSGIGTSLHAMLEHRLLGHKYPEPEPFKTDLDAILRCLEQHKVEVDPALVERTVLCPKYGTGGTFDFIGRHQGVDWMGDLKTGDSLDLSAGKISVQLHQYSVAEVIWDYGHTKEQDTHRPLPNVDQDFGFVIHCPAGSGEARLVWVDIAAGEEAAQVICWIKGDWRKRKPSSFFFPERPALEPSSTVEQPEPDREDWLRSEYERIKAHPNGKPTLKDLWPPGVPTFKQAPEGSHSSEQLEAIADALRVAAQHLQLAFSDDDGDPGPPVDDTALRAAASIGAGDDPVLQGILLDTCDHDRVLVAAIVNAMADFVVTWEQTKGQWHLVVDENTAEKALVAKYGADKRTIIKSLNDVARLIGHDIAGTYKSACANPVVVAVALNSNQAKEQTSK